MNSPAPLVSFYRSEPSLRAGPKLGALVHSGGSIPQQPFATLSAFEKSLIEATLPGLELTMPAREGYTLNKQKLINILQCYGEDCRAPLQADLAKAKKLHADNEITYRKLEAHAAALELQLQAAHAATRAAAEGRGLHENKRLAGLLARNEAKTAEIAELKQRAHDFDIAAQRARNEAAAHPAVIATYEREKSELMGAAVLTASAMQTAAAHVAEARDNLGARYGAKNPFINTVTAELTAALARLPAPISPS